MSGCQRFGPLLDGYHDRELGPFARWRVRRHLARCGGCRLDLASLRAVGSWVRESSETGVEPGVELWNAIAERLPVRRPRQAPARQWMPRPRVWLPPVAVSLAAAALAGVVWLEPFAPPDAERVFASSGVVRSIFAPTRPVMVFEAERADEPTIIWLGDELGERNPEVSKRVRI